MKGTIRAAFAIGLILLPCAGAHAVTIDWVTVGDAGNAADTRYDYPPGYGAVGYEYRIGKYEITNAQYREFLTAKASLGDPHGLYSTDMAGTYGGISRSGSGIVGDPYVYSAKGGDSNWDSRPVCFVSFWDIARFANWMHNGQGNGDTETGAYLGIEDQATFARQPGALYFIPSEDEWYKAAYYKGGGLDAGYWEYPTQSDTLPTWEPPPGTDLVDGSANYFDGFPRPDPAYYSTPVGAYTAKPSVSAYGTYDQGGNIYEWTETGASLTDPNGIRGGSWGGGSMAASDRNDTDGPWDDDSDRGFRLAGSLEQSAAIPEPATLSLLGLGVAALLRRRRA